MFDRLKYLEERKRNSVLTQLLASPIRQISSPIRELSSPIIQLSSQSIHNAVIKTRTPTPQSETRNRINQVDFHDPNSVAELASRLTSKRRKEAIVIGEHIGEKSYSYSVHFGGKYFPMDYFADTTRPATALTYIKCSSRSSIPKIILQLGQLRYSHVSDADPGASNGPEHDGPNHDSTRSMDTYFVVGVDIIDRMAWALWNPDQFDAIDGVLPGFHKACTAIPFNKTIDELLANSSTQRLDLNPERFLTVPRGSSVRYGGVDENGWTILANFSFQYKKASRVYTDPKTA